MIIHVDMDAFYASVEVRDNPDLAGKPVVVGGSPKGRGVVSAASYEARRFGIHSAMPAATAVRLCPQAIFVKPRMEHYVSVSREIREIFHRFTPLVEPISLDEAFLDVEGSQCLFGEPQEIAQLIKRCIDKELNLTASAGVAPNKFLAKVASDLDKPDGLVVVPADGVQQFLDPLPIRRVWGIGPKTERRFNSLGVASVAGIRCLPRETLQKQFGINSEHFWRLSRGLDTRPVVPERSAKSISHENTFPVDLTDPEILRAWVQELSCQVAMRLRRLGIRGKKVQIKVRFADFRTITRQQTLEQSSCTTRRITDAARALLNKVLNQHPWPIRLIGVGVGGLTTDQAVQKTLFDQGDNERDLRIDRTCDALRQKFGSRVVQSAAAMQQGIGLQRRAVTEDRQSE